MVAPLPEKLTPELVFREYAPRIYNIDRRMLGNDADAEDVTQDVLLQVVRKLDTFRGDAQISTWLHRVTVNAALMKIRSRSRRPEVQAEESLLFQSPRRPESGGVPPALDALGRGEILEAVRLGLSRLPEEIRAVVRLRDIEGMELREISGLLGVCCSTVKTRLHRGRMALRGLLEARFGALE